MHQTWFGKALYTKSMLCLVSIIANEQKSNTETHFVTSKIQQNPCYDSCNVKILYESHILSCNVYNDTSAIAV